MRGMVKYIESLTFIVSYGIGKCIRESVSNKGEVKCVVIEWIMNWSKIRWNICTISSVFGKLLKVFFKKKAKGHNVLNALGIPVNSFYNLQPTH